MRKIIFGISMMLCTYSLCAQTANVNWGDDFKMHRGSTDLSVVYADNSGVFVREGHLAVKSIFGASARESATLVKLDKSFAQEYHNDFNKELKGKEFEDFFFIKDKAYIMASDYSRKEKTLKLFAGEIDKSSGELSGDWKEVTSWQKDEKSDDLDFKISYNADSSRMIVVSTDEGKEQSKYEVKEFDSKMAESAPPITISTDFNPKTFQLEDVIYTVTGNIVLVGRAYEYIEGKKKKDKNLEFRNYIIRLYNNKGSLVKEINTDIKDKWLVSTKVAQVPNKDKDIVLAAFYSDAKRGEVNGMFVQRISPVTGEVLTTGQQELSTSMISVVDDSGDDDESKQDKKEREKLEKIQSDDDGFSRYLQFRNFIYTEDKGIVIVAEKYHHYTYITSEYMPNGVGGGGSWRTTTHSVYECGDIMMSKMDAAGKIAWLHVLPKSQKESFEGGSSSGFGFSIGYDYFSSFNYPFYAGLTSFGLPGQNTVAILFNDNPKNADVLQLGQRVKLTTRFGKSDCYALYLDAATGKYKRVSLFSNHDQPTAMPRLGVPMGKDFYLIGKDDKVMAKTKIAVGAISFK